MSKFHSVVSRREFMKALGLVGAGIGAANVAAPVFHDLDELTSSSQSIQKRPWWVKQVDEPTIEIDWDQMKRHDGRLQGQASYTKALYYGKDRVVNAGSLGSAAVAEHAGESGYRFRDNCLYSAISNMWGVDVGVRGAGDYGWAGDKPLYKTAKYTKTPEELGVPKWSGSPEEASKMMRAALRLFGTALVGFGEIGQHEREHVFFSHEKGGANSNSYIDKWPPPDTVARPIVYEDVDVGYETTSKLVLPTKQMYEISVSTQSSNELFRCTPAWGGMANRVTFAHQGGINGCCYNFLRALGYQEIGTIGNDARYLGSEGPGAILHGLGEASRQQLYVLTPEHGAPGRLYNVATDLPLEPSKPIDAGMYRFCHSCHKCANACPPGAISQDKEPSWERPVVNGKEAVWTVFGTKAFVQNGPLCSLYNSEAGDCKLCWGECTFTVNSSAMVHQIVQAEIATTGLFNGFLFNMAETFGYGSDSSKAEDWWSLSLPIYGIDSTRVAWDGGYRK